MKRTLQICLAAFAVALFACGDPPTPESPPQPTNEPKPEPKPEPPQCDRIKDKCKATGDTRVPVVGTSYTFSPPVGWIYAKLEEATVAQKGDEGPVIVWASFEPDKNIVTANKQRTELVDSLATLVLIEPPKPMSMLAPNTTQEMGGLKMNLWEKANAKRGKDTGALLILAALAGDRELLGVGFAPKDDEAGTGEVLKSVQSLASDGKDAKGDDKDKADKKK